MDLSVILCTYNRAHNLPACIDHIMRSKGVDDVAWELLVVDNNSKDATAEIIAGLQKQYPHRLRYVFEGRQGLSWARNKGIASTLARYLVFVDDDIRVTPLWLSAIVACFRQNDSDALGGRIWLDESVRLPAWISQDMMGFLGYLDYGDKPFVMDGRSSCPFGGNMAFQRRVFESVGVFDTRMGRKGEGLKADELFKGEEIDLFERLADKGGRIDYVPDAIVYHNILPHQLRKQFFRTLHYNAGYLKAALDTETYGNRIFGVPRFVFAQALRAALKYFRSVVINGIDRAFRQQMTFGYFLGMIAGYLHKHRDAGLRV